ncbi:MAG: hypothetical protein WA912_06215 [Ornithinimicrobium sp.]
MSYDLHVFGRSGEPVAALAAVLAAFPHQVHGFGAAVRGNRPEALLTIDGPLDVDREDIPAEVLKRVLAPSVVYQLSATSSYRQPDARRLARGLSDAVEGAVYDCQDGQLLWPRSRTGHRRTGTVTAEDGLVDALHLSWYFRPADLPDRFEHRLLDLMRGSLPEAVPQRYGDYEPPQHRLERDGDDHFTAFAATMDGTFWTGRRPVVSAHYTRRLGRSVHRSQARQVGYLEISLLLDAVDTPAWRAELQYTLVSIAELSRAFYAQAAVGRRYRGVRLASDGDTRSPEPLATGYGWQGLPNRPVWLAWFGDIYRPLVEAHLTSPLPLIRTAEHPAAATRLTLPPEMKVRNAETSRPGQSASQVPEDLKLME